MSIETTYFDVKYGSENVKAVYDWMRTNATEYFDTFENSSEDISCSFIKGDAKIKYITNEAGNNNQTYIQIFLKSGAAANLSLHTASSTQTTPCLFISRAIKTNSGIILSWSSSDATTKYYDYLFISKTNTGNTGCICGNSLYKDSGSYYWPFSLGDSTAAKDCIKLGILSYLFSHPTTTSFANIPCFNGSEEYFPNMYITPFYTTNSGQIADENGIVYISGKNPNTSIQMASIWLKD